MANATWKQAKTIWGFCVKHGTKNTDWAKLAKEGTLSLEQASSIITAIKADVYSEATALIQGYIPEFKIGKPGDNPPSEPIETPEEETKKSVLDEILELEEERTEDEVKLTGKEAAKKLDEKLKGLGTILNQKTVDQIKGLVAQAIKDASKLPEYVTKGTGYIKPDIFDKIVAMIKGGVQVFLNGDAGCGKSRLFEEVAKVLEIPFYTFSMSGGMRYSQVFGSIKISNGSSEFQEGELLKAIQKPGLVFIDEILGADPDVNLGLNPITEQNIRAIETPKGTIRVHKDCIICAAANTTGRQFDKQYTGAKRADDSLLDRFVTVHMGYDEKVERTIIKNSGIEQPTGEYFLSNLKKLREAVRQQAIAFSPSTRRLINCIKVYKSGLKKEESFEYTFLSSLSKGERAKVGL